LSDISSTNITPSGATINWTTNQPADTQIEYGTTTAYGNKTTLDPTMVTLHSNALSGLNASTTYNYRVISRDASGSQAVSDNLTFTTSAPPPPPPPAGITGYWQFDENAETTAFDASGNGLNGTLTGGTQWAPLSAGSALKFDGSTGYVNLGNPAALQITGSMTISAWIYASAFPGDDAAIVSKRDSGGIGYQLDAAVDLGPRTVSFSVTDGRTGAQIFRYGTTTLETGKWYYVAGTYDASAQTINVYVNGRLDDGALNGKIGSSQRNSSQNVNIGNRPGAPGFLFNGMIDDVRIYSRPLTAEEIATDMSSHPPDPAAAKISMLAPANGSIAPEIEEPRRRRSPLTVVSMWPALRS
jgi:hypothetical protein